MLRTVTLSLVMTSLIACHAGTSARPLDDRLEPRPLVSKSRPVSAEPDKNDVLDASIGFGLTVGDVRRANEALAARPEAGRAGPAMAICRKLAAAGLVAHCANIGPGYMGLLDRASFELPDPTRGRGLIHHYGSAEDFERGLGAVEQLGSFHVENPRTGILFLGAEALTADEVKRVRAIIAAP